jgi:hypothetical protein
MWIDSPLVPNGDPPKRSGRILRRDVLVHMQSYLHGKLARHFILCGLHLPRRKCAGRGGCRGGTRAPIRPRAVPPRPARWDGMVATNGPDVGRRRKRALAMAKRMNVLVASACASRRAIPRRAPRAPRQGKARSGESHSCPRGHVGPIHGPTHLPWQGRWQIRHRRCRASSLRVGRPHPDRAINPGRKLRELDRCAWRSLPLSHRP